jgi:glutamate dehydrogenase/leucine dehydrogenase
MPANVGRLQSRIVAECVNIGWALADRDVLALPDFIANADGVICAAVEYRSRTEKPALALIDEEIRAKTKAVLDEVRRWRCLPRIAAISTCHRESAPDDAAAAV